MFFHQKKSYVPDISKFIWTDYDNFLWNKFIVITIKFVVVMHLQRVEKSKDCNIYHNKNKNKGKNWKRKTL